MTRSLDNELLAFQMKRVTDLELALSAAINLLSIYEHGDSRCTSDAFVALNAVNFRLTDDACIKILTEVSIADYSKAREEDLKYVQSQCTVTYGND